MRECGQAYQLCPCYKESKEFHKVWELKDSGLMVYCHRTSLNNVAQGECNTNTSQSQDVFILDNEKNVKIPTSELTTDLEKKNISCPRCRETFRHAQELLKKVKLIDRKTVMGICDHCRKSAQTSKKPFCICDEIVKKYISVKDTQKDNIKTKVKIWLSKLGHILKDEITHYKPKQIKTSSHSEIQIIQSLKSPPASKHEPEIQQMFYSGLQKSDISLEISGTDLKEGTQTVTFAEPIEPVETSFDHTTNKGEQIQIMTPVNSMADSVTTIVETHVGVKDFARPSLKGPKHEIPSMDAKAALKRRHDLSLRHMMGFQIDSEVTESPDIYEISKSAPWEQKEPTTEYQVEPEIDKKIQIPTKPKHGRRPRGTPDPDYVPVKPVTHGSSRTSEKDVQDHFEKRKELYPAVETLKLQRSVTKFGRKMKKPLVIKSGRPIQTAGNVLQPKFSFLFPKDKKKEEMQLTLNVSSSHLIKETQEKFHLQAEREKQKQEEERQQKLERDQEDKLKKLQAEEDEKLADEFKKIADEQEMLKKYKKYSEKDLDTKQTGLESKSFSQKDLSDEEKRDKSKRDKLKDDISAKKGELISEHELRHKVSEDSGETKKGLKSTSKKDLQKGKKESSSKPEQKDKTYDDLQKAEKDFKSKSEQKDKTDEDLQKGKKYSKSKTDQKDKTDEDLQKAKKDFKSKSEQKDKTDEDLQKARKYSKSKTDQKDKTDEDLQKARKYSKSKTDQKDKTDEDLQKARKYSKSKTDQKDKTDEDLQKARKYSKSKTDQKDKTDEDLQKAKKDFKSKPEQRDKTDEGLQKARKLSKSKTEQKDRPDEDFQKAKKDSKSKPEQKDKTGEDFQKAKKDSKSRPEQKDKTDEDFQKTKKDLRSKSEQQDKNAKEKLEAKEKGGVKVTEKGTKEMKEKPEKEKDRKDVKSATQLKTKMAKDQQDEKQLTEKEKEQKLKLGKDKQPTEQLTEREKPQNEKEAKEKGLQIKKEHEERMKQAEQLRKEKDGLKQQAMKDKENVSKDTDAPSKKEKRTKNTDEIKVSITDIQKSLKKEKSEIREKQVNTKTETVKKEKALPKVVDKAAEELKKMQAEHLKEKEELLKKKNQQEYEAKLAKAKEEIERKAKQLELSMHDVKIAKHVDAGDEILKLVKIKQAAKLRACDLDPNLIHAHKCGHEYIPDGERCPICDNSELELELLSLEHKQNLPTTIITDVIIGEHIIKNKRLRREEPEEQKNFPSLYHRHYFSQYPLTLDNIDEIIPQEPEPTQKMGAAFLLAKKNGDEGEADPGKGILHYALSDRAFIEKGWTMLPTEKVVRKMNVYRMRPAHPEFDWFEHNKKKRLMTYDTGEKLAEFDDNGRGRLYYKSGRLALDYYDAEETNAQQRFVTYSSGEPDERGRTHPITILSTFDYLGNGIVFDHAGKIRLKYNQTEGVVLDRGIGPVSHWKWHTLNDPPVLQQVMIDTQMAHKDPNILKLGPLNEQIGRPDNEEMLAIEFDNFIKEKSKKLSQKFKPFQIKMKALKINEHFSLKVLDQATVYLIFRDGTTNVKLNIGMILDHQEIVDTDTAEVGEVSNSMERFPARTDSLAGLQRSVAYAQRYERQTTERERRLRPQEPCGSADLLTAAASRPMRPPFRTVPTGGTSTSTSTSTGYSSRKPPNNLYYNTRLL